MKKGLLPFLILLATQYSYAQKSTGLVFTPSSTAKKTVTAIPPYFRSPIPAHLDLSDNLPPVGSQHPQNSCVGWALGYACRSYYIYKDLEDICKDDPYYLELSVISPAFIYNLLNKGKNNGINLYRALRLLIDTGACLMRSMPYDPYDWKKKPDYYQLHEAKKYKIEAFRKIDLDHALVNLKAALLGGNPVVCAAYYDNNYFNNGYNSKATHYIWKKLTTSNQTIGHAIVLVGYDDTLRAFKFMNSWGENWGNKGYGWVSYDLADKVIREAYVIKPRDYYSSSGTKSPTKPQQTQPKDNYNPNKPPVTNNMVFDWEHYTPERKEAVTKWLGEILARDSTEVLLGIAYEKLYEDSSQEQMRQSIITINGMFNVAPTQSGEAYVAVPLFLSAGGKPGLPIMSNSTDHQLANGQVAVVSDFKLADDWDGRKKFWQAIIALNALKLPAKSETTNASAPTKLKLVGVPVLFLDNFPMATGKPYEFEITY